MNIDIEVNGIVVTFNIEEGFKHRDVDLHTLLRKGDECEVLDGGVRFKGRVENIIRLSKGKTLYSVRMLNNVVTDSALYEDWQVAPVDATQCALRLTALELLLKKYEPKGMSTNTYSL